MSACGATPALEAPRSRPLLSRSEHVTLPPRAAAFLILLPLLAGQTGAHAVRTPAILSPEELYQFAQHGAAPEELHHLAQHGAEMPVGVSHLTHSLEVADPPNEKGEARHEDGKSHDEIGRSGVKQSRYVNFAIRDHPAPADASASRAATVTGEGASESRGPLFASQDAELSSKDRSDPDDLDAGSAGRVLVALGAGTGTSVGGTGNRSLDREMAVRMRYQDSAVMLLMIMVYFVTLSLLASLTYRRAQNNSQVTYYADPRFHHMVMEGNDPDAFLDAFNQAPKNVQLQVTGFVPLPDGVLGSVQWQGDFYHVAFTFSLDLSTWVVKQTGEEDDKPLVDGMDPEDFVSLRDLLENCDNDLACIEVQKDVAWPEWEELATNIKQCIRQRGFGGLIGIHRTESESFLVHKNKPWANFLHNRTTKVLCALSLVGWIFYIPYMWLRNTRRVVRSRFKVEIDINNYWPLIAEHLSADGFIAVTS